MRSSGLLLLLVGYVALACCALVNGQPGLVHEGDKVAEVKDHDDDHQLDYKAFIKAHGINNGQKDAVCTLQTELSKSGVLCPTMATWLAMTQVWPGHASSVRKGREPSNPNKDLPKPLTAFNPSPAYIPPETAKAERLTYYFYYRLILNAYDHAYHNHKGLLNAPSGWKGSVAHATKAEDGLPLAHSFVRDDTLLVVVRGTVTSQEWEQDFKYYWADTKTSGKFFAGDVHAGFFELFLNLHEALEKDIDSTPQVTRVTVVGHSLGGAVANLLAFHAAKYKPGLVVEVVTFGTPSVGCPVFTKSFGEVVNSRQIKFAGNGNGGGGKDGGDGGSYEVGDFIGAVSCGVLEACPLLSTFESDREGEKYEYGQTPGVHRFTSSDLKNSRTWRMKNDRLSLLFDPISNHLCSYLCYTAQGSGDKDDRCFFLLDVTSTAPLQFRCSPLW